MNKKMKDCFTPHVVIHSTFGLGLGLLLANLEPGLANKLLGIGLMVLAVALDYTRKN